MRIYTRTGDGGTTGLLGGARVPKSDPRIMSYGAVDEVNSILGVILSDGADKDISGTLTGIQNDLFTVGSDLSNPDMDDHTVRVTDGMVKRLEAEIDRLESETEPLSNFVLPGGSRAAALMHLARTTTRRAESLAVALGQAGRINAHCTAYLNRLSDLLFVMARAENRRRGVPDTVWSIKDTL